MRRSSILALAALILLNIAVFGQILGHTFIAYDDGQFVYENKHVQQGLTAESVRWALTSTELGFYPLTWLSHMLDAELYGLNPRGHFASALLFHLLASWAVFAAIQRLTRNVAGSAVVAALFAIHPMHVESVAWISERRDTLSTLFGMTAIALYAGRRTAGRMLLVSLAFAASLLSKQMFVTLPFVLLVLDWWPLGRLPREFRRAVVEKIPLFLLSGAGIAVALLGQSKMEAVQAATDVVLSLRLQNAVVAYARYVGKLFVPIDLNPLYPFAEVSATAVAVSALLLLAITALAFRLRRTAPYLLAGWLWFVGTLVPVIGIVKIGVQAMADRYTYVPYIGLFVAMVWGVGDLAARFGLPRKAVAAVAVAVITAFAFVAWRQTRLWKDTETLFTHTIAVTGPNPSAQYALGQTLQLTDPDRALEYFGRAISISESMLPTRVRPPREPYVQSYVGSGTALLMKARREMKDDPAAAVALIERAEQAYRRAIELDARQTGNASRNLALAARMKARLAPPPPLPTRAVSTRPLIHDGVRRMNASDVDGAIRVFQEAVALEPGKAAPRIYLAMAFMKGKQNAEAIEQLREAKRLDPARANEYVTRALGVPPAPDNLDALIEKLGG